MKRYLIEFLRDESGPTATEYAVMLALIVGTCLVSIGFFGTSAGGSWFDTSARIDAAMNN
ncbi:MAG TPA: Flp family type IVb pilin [Pirellulaceae bacterium]|nr:Flp family type IVb pilin [Pirellulaceae bacterium]